MEHDAEPLRLLSRRRQVEAGSGRLDALLGPADALRHGRLGHEEGPGDLGGRQAADGPQGQRDLRRGRQRRVAAQEQQREGVVAGGATGFEVGVRLATGGGGGGGGRPPPPAGGRGPRAAGGAGGRPPPPPRGGGPASRRSGSARRRAPPVTTPPRGFPGPPCTGHWAVAATSASWTASSQASKWP